MLGEACDTLVTAAESVAITEARFRQRRLERELTETEDWFTERADRRAEEQRQRDREGWLDRVRRRPG